MFCYGMDELFWTPHRTRFPPKSIVDCRLRLNIVPFAENIETNVTNVRDQTIGANKELMQANA